MAAMRWCFKARPSFIVGILVALGCAAPLHAAEDVTVSAKVDKTTVDVGSPLQLTLTITGDLTGVQMQPLEFPENCIVASRSQATNFSLRAGVQERSMTLLYVLVSHEAGTFQLGPFVFTRGKQTFHTEPIDITVSKPALPPKLRTPAERFIL